MQAPKVAPRWFLLIPLVLIIFNLYTIMGTLTISPQYADLDVSFSPVLRLGIGLVWIVVFGALTVGLIIRRPFAYLWIAPALTIYGLANLVQGILWAQAELHQGAVWLSSYCNGSSVDTCLVDSPTSKLDKLNKRGKCSD
jgi:hypothetical protein